MTPSEKNMECIVQFPLAGLRESERFKNLMPTRPPKEQAELNADVAANGVLEPVDVWRVQNVIVDGYGRTEAARSAASPTIPVVFRDFENAEAAERFAVIKNVMRRHLTNADRLRLVRKLYAAPAEHPEQPRESGRFTVPPNGGNGGRQSAEIANLVGLSQRTVERVIGVINAGDDDVIENLEAGKISITKAANLARARQSEAPPGSKGKPKFNLTNEHIEWAIWSWNPSTGCRHHITPCRPEYSVCQGCYAHEIALGSRRAFPHGFEYAFYPERLTAPANTKIPARLQSHPGARTVFVSSMGDMFGAWVPREDIDRILAAESAYPAWRYLHLTKNPIRLLKFEWQPHQWVGVTVHLQERVDEAVAVLGELRRRREAGAGPGVVFLSCEPLLEPVTFVKRGDPPGAGHNFLAGAVDWLIIGARSAVRRPTRVPEFQPPWPWVEALMGECRSAGVKIYLKPNLTSRPREYPEMALPQLAAPATAICDE